MRKLTEMRKMLLSSVRLAGSVPAVAVALGADIVVWSATIGVLAGLKMLKVTARMAEKARENM